MIPHYELVSRSLVLCYYQWERPFKLIRVSFPSFFSIWHLLSMFLYLFCTFYFSLLHSFLTSVICYCSSSFLSILLPFQICSVLRQYIALFKIPLHLSRNKIFKNRVSTRVNHKKKLHMAMEKAQKGPDI
jgi:hypothetical protein